MKNKKNVSMDIFVYSMMIVAVIYAIYQSLTGNNDKIYYKILLGVWILIAVVLNDFVEPVINHAFDDMSNKKIGQYTGYAVADAVAYTGLYMFVINVGKYSEPIHYIFLGTGIAFFALKIMLYKNFLKKEKRQERIEEILKEEEQEAEETRLDNMKFDSEVATFKSHTK